MSTNLLDSIGGYTTIEEPHLYQVLVRRVAKNLQTYKRRQVGEKDYRYIYGPVASWRLGRSLGIDPVSGRVKVCSFDCIYCQAGKTAVFTDRRDIFVSAENIARELNSLPALKIDYITFSGAGEPTLAKNLGQMIRAVRKMRTERIAVLTNSSLIHRKDVQRDLSLADFVVAKLDAPSQQLFEKVNRPMQNLKLAKTIKGIKEFKSKYRGRLGLQIMFSKENKRYAREIAAIAKDINPDEVQLNTPLRPCGVKPLSRKDMQAIKAHFTNMNAVSVYDVKNAKIKPLSKNATVRRRGKI